MESKLHPLILAYDEGAWHPDERLYFIFLFLGLVSTVAQVQFAVGERRKVLVFLILLPWIYFYCFVLYVQYGNSGGYTGYGTIGPGANVSLLSLVTNALGTAFLAIPSLIVLALVYWEWLRVNWPVVYWPLFALMVCFALIWLAVASLVDL